MLEYLDDLLRLVQEANPHRNLANISRRLLKMEEEKGELAQAYLQVTSMSNSKNKTWHDVREEGIDTVLPIIDIILTPMPNQVAQTDDERRAAILKSLADMPLPELGLDEDRLLAFTYGRGESSFGNLRRFVEAYFSTKELRVVDPFYQDASGEYDDWWHVRYYGLTALLTLLSMLLTAMPDQTTTTFEARQKILRELLVIKLSKWHKNRLENTQTTDDAV